MPDLATTEKAPSALASVEKAALAESAVSSPATGAEEHPPDSTPAAPSDRAATAPSAVKEPGPIPLDRHEQILKNAREQARADTLREWQDKYGWAEKVRREDIEEAIGLAQRLNQDPSAFLRQLAQEIGVSVEEEPKVPEPQPDLQTEDGSIRAYSAAQMAKWAEWREKRLMHQFDERIKPLADHTKAQQDEAHTTQIIHQARTLANQVYTQACEELPHFKEHQEAIAEKLEGLPDEVRNRLGSVASLYWAYSQVLKEKVLPGISQQAEGKVLAGLKKKAAASAGDVRPAAGGETTVKRPRTVEELADVMRQKAGASAA